MPNVMTPRDWIAAVLAGLLYAASAGPLSAAEAGKRPNVLIINRKAKK